MSTDSERDRIVAALDNLRSRPPFEDERHIDHDPRRGGYFAACPLCKAKPEPIADALVADGWVLRRAEDIAPGRLTEPHPHIPDERGWCALDGCSRPWHDPVHLSAETGEPIVAAVPLTQKEEG